jgi:hypothetical protein
MAENITPEQFKENTLRLKIESRGGGIEIDLKDFGFAGRMTAHQHYLGGGMLGSIKNDCTIKDWKTIPELNQVASQLAEYYHQLREDGTEFEEVQTLPHSAY